MAKKTYVLDTNVYLTDAQSILSFDNNDILVPLKVLDEIDKHKKRQDSVGVQARSTIRSLDQFRAKGNLYKGIRIDKGKGILKVRGYNPLCLPDDLDLEDSDNQILATALSEMQDNKSRKVIVVSRDINMRVKCDALGILTEDYQVEQVVAGEPMGPMAGLAICSCGEGSAFYLFGCDPEWSVVTDTYHDSLDDAMDQAEFEYEGVSKTWIRK